MNGTFISENAGKFLLVSMLLFVSVGCRAIEHRLLYSPDCFPHRWNQPVESELAGLDFEEAHFSSLDGNRLHGWFVAPSGVKPDNILLFAHGRSGNITTYKTSLFEFIRRHQVAILVFDYRGYGKSEGHPTESGLYADVVAARDWLARRTGVENSEIILMGRSLGAAVAIDLASREGAKALIVECGFTSMKDIVRHHSRHLLTGRHLQSDYDSYRKISRYTGPVFISHGRSDKTIPISQGARLAAAAATSTNVVYFVETDGRHKSPPTETYKLKLDEFLRSL